MSVSMIDGYIDEPKLTDEKIIKALECCGINKNCKGCYLDSHEADDICTRVLIQNALDLINRQKAEIDDLKRDTIPKLQDGLKRANKYGVETDKENQQLKAEIERLRELNDESFQYDLELMKQEKSVVEAIARQEFAERLKQKTKQIQITYHLEYDVVFASEIDNLLKEMVGDNNGRTQQADTESANT